MNEEKIYYYKKVAGIIIIVRKHIFTLDLCRIPILISIIIMMMNYSFNEKNIYDI